MSDPFSRASNGARIADYEGRLVLVTPTEYLEEVETKFGKSDAIDADVVVLDGPEGVEQIDQMRIFQAAMIAALKRKIGSAKPMLLGRVATKPNPKGDKPIWIFAEVNDGDAKLAREYLASKHFEPAQATAGNPYA